MKKYSFKSVIFDLDGVITTTAAVHAKAWKVAFDEYLRLREKRDHEQFKEFTHDADYLPFVDGKPRYEGVKSFLESRNINIPFGDPADSPDKETVCGIGNKKNAEFTKIIEEDGVEVYSSTIALIKSLKKAGVHIGVASSSKNCQKILQSVGIEDLFETRVDGVVSARIGLKGKPEADIFVAAARNVGARPVDSVVVEDAVSGVAAGRNGGFGLVVGIARKDNASDLFDNGADVVVSDLAQIDLEIIEKWFHREPKPLFRVWDELPKEESCVNPSYRISPKSVFLGKKKPVFFLDYDGTLTPIVSRPDLAVLSSDMKTIIKNLADKFTVAIVSGRMRADVEQLVGIQGLFYAGSHGFDITGPNFSMIKEEVKAIVPVVSQVIDFLKKELGSIDGLLVEEKKFSVAVHYRLVDEKKYLSTIRETVNDVVGKYKALRLMDGKKIFEILPDIDWDKGKAIRWIMRALGINWSMVSVIYIGDDTTDEYAFRAIRTRGTGVLVSDKIRVSAAQFYLSSTKKVKELFEKVIISF
ncbi:MAG: trehalose-phosphatase [Candidatus Omnitrophica bacterium]|nr:trehalose-phosphatase [Candidatus Omnitrophota bacterium]